MAKKAKKSKKKTYYQTRQKTFKRIVFDVPRAMYDLFLKSPVRKCATNDAEALRSMLRDALGD